MTKAKLEGSKDKLTEWYSDKDIYDLLKHYAGRDYINISSTVDNQTQLEDHLNQQSLQLGKPQHIIPLNVSALTGELGKNTNHWVGLYIIVGSNSSVEVNYVNPMGYGISHVVKEIIESQLKQSFTSVLIKQPLLNQAIQYVEKKLLGIKLSGNTDDCGPMLVYAMACYTRALEPIKISDRAESVSLGSYLRESFEKRESFNNIYVTLSKHTDIISNHDNEIATHIDIDISTILTDRKKENFDKETKQDKLQINEQQLKEINSSITEHEKKLFPEFQLNKIDQLPDPKEEKEEALKQIDDSYKLGLLYYQANQLELAEEKFVKVLKPVLSKPTMKNLYVDTKDVQEISTRCNISPWSNLLE